MNQGRLIGDGLHAMLVREPQEMQAEIIVNLFPGGCSNLPPHIAHTDLAMSSHPNDGDYRGVSLTVLANCRVDDFRHRDEVCALARDDFPVLGLKLSAISIDVDRALIFHVKAI